MLDGIHITENDSLYLYNYETNKLQKIPVSKLKAVAYLSPYIVEGDEVDAESYMVGFQVDTQKGNDIFDKYMNVIAYFGSKNPFVENKMKMIKWEKADADIQKNIFPVQHLNMAVPTNINTKTLPIIYRISLKNMVFRNGSW